MCHTAAEWTCELVHDDIDHFPMRYFGIGILSINCIKVVLDWTSLPEFENLQVCPIRAVMVSIISIDTSQYFSTRSVLILVSLPPGLSFS